MKKISLGFTILCFCVWSFVAFSLSKSELVGTWLWSSVGCRDTNLSMSSHQPIADNNQNPDLISEATFVFNRNDSASMDFVQDGESQSYSGTYEIVDNGDVVNLIPGNLPQGVSADDAKFRINVVNNDTRLAVVRCEADYEADKQIPGLNTDEIEEIDEKIEVLRDICGRDKCFVYLIGKV